MIGLQKRLHPFSRERLSLVNPDSKDDWAAKATASIQLG
jgi:hypothetical protein